MQMAGRSRQKLMAFVTKLAYIPAKYHYNSTTRRLQQLYGYV